MEKDIHKLDKPVFGLASDEYAKFRPTYPKELYEIILENISENHFDHALDVGGGTGISAIPLLENFEKVSILDPDKKLLDHVVEDKFHQIIHSSIENYEFPESSFFNLVTFGNAFYWTDGKLILEKLAKKAEIISAYRYDFPVILNASNDVLKKHLDDHWDKFRHDRLRNHSYTIDCFKESGLFREVRVHKIEYIKNLSILEFVGFISSTSYASSYIRLLNDEKAQKVYKENLIEEIENMSDSDIIRVDFSLELVIGIK